MTNRIFGILIPLILAPAAAFGGMVDVKLNSIPYGRIVKISQNGGSSYQTVYAGQLAMTLTNSTTGNLSNGDYKLFCTELSQTTWVGADFQYTVTDLAQVPNTAPLGVAKADAIRGLYAYANGAQYGTDANYAAAFQIAVWEVANDYNSLSLTGGLFRVKNLTTEVSSYLTTLLSSLPTAASSTHALLGLSNANRQDFIVQVPTMSSPGSASMVPEPTSFCLWAMGMTAMGAFVRPRRRA